MTRDKTRRERYSEKIRNAIKLPVSFATVNFEFDDNLAFLIRTAACFGVYDIYVIGSIPPRSILNPKSGSLYDYVNLHQFSNVRDFMSHIRERNIKMISAEIGYNASSLYDYKFCFNSETVIVLGNEQTGVPVEIALNSENVYIPMPGVGYCLNTSQTGTAIITEYSRQYFLQ